MKKNYTNFTKPVGVEVFGTHIQDRSAEYRGGGCKAAAVGLYKISAEYFSNENCDGQYFNPTDHMYSALSSLEAHTDRNEGNFGHFSQQIRKEPTARLHTVNSKIVM